MLNFIQLSIQTKGFLFWASLILESDTKISSHLEKGIVAKLWFSYLKKNN